MWMLLPLAVKVGEVWHRQRGGASPWRTAKQGGLQPLFVPILTKRPPDSRRFGSLQILVDGSEANRTTTGDLPQPKAHFKSQSQNFFGLAHGQSPGWQAILPFLGRLPAIVLSSAVGLWKLIRRSRTRFRDRPKTVRLHPGFDVHLHPGSLFGFIRN